MSTLQKNRKLLDEVRDVMRLHHYSIHTERTYCDWIKRYIRYHRMTDRQDLIDGEAKIEAYLTHLAVDKAVAPSTQNQAMNALVFLYKQVLKRSLDGKINAVRAANVRADRCAGVFSAHPCPARGWVRLLMLFIVSKHHLVSAL